MKNLVPNNCYNPKMSTMKILAINPGSTSTKMAVFENDKEVFNMCLRHSVEDLEPFSKVIDQFDFRKNLVLKAFGRQWHSI